MNLFRFVLLLIALGFAAEPLQAQVRWYRAPVVPYGAGYGYGGYSPVEGYQRGMADVIRSSGQAAESYSKARINNEDARSKFLDNKLKWTEIYWKRKRLGEAELAKDHAEDRERRQKWLASNRDRKPDTLGPSQYDTQTGFVDWPEALAGAEYASHREQIETELKIQAKENSSSSATKIRTLAREMQAILKGHIRDMPANVYLGARKFLDRLVNQMVLAQQE